MYHKGDLKNQLLSIRKLGGLDMKLEGTERSRLTLVDADS